MTTTIVGAIKEAEKSIGAHLLRIMDPNEGDLRFTWDPDIPEQVGVARDSFYAAREKGMVGYKVRRDGSKGTIAKEFDPRAEAIIMAPPLVGG